MHSSIPASTRDHVDSLAREACLHHDVPAGIALYAARATLRALESRRLEAVRAPRRRSDYFWAVVRRRLVAVGGSSIASARLVLSAVVEDLTMAGRDSRAVWREIERGWGDRVPPEVLEEYRVRLCA